MKRWLLAVLLVVAWPSLVFAETCFLKQSTALSTGIRVGPFIDSTDGITVKTGLSLAQADVRLSKAEGAFAQKGDSTTCSELEFGWYACPLNTTDTGTVGLLTIGIAKSGALPYAKTCAVLEANSYDALISGTGTGIRASVQANASPTVMGGINIKKGSTQVTLSVPIRSSATSALLTGLAYNTGSNAGRYCRKDQGNANCTAVVWVTKTRGTWTSAGFVEKQSGVYEVDFPDAAWAVGADQVDLVIEGGTNAATVVINVDLFDTSANDVTVKLGTPTGASVSGDIAAVSTKLGAPAGASMSADIAAIATETAKLGTPVGASVSADIAAVAVATAAVSTKLGTPTGATVSADIATVMGRLPAALQNGHMDANTSSVYRKNVGGQRGFQVWLFNADGTAYTGAPTTPTVQVNKDATGWTAAGGTLSGGGVAGDGFFMFTPSQADTNCDACGFRVQIGGVTAARLNVTTQP